MDHGVAVRQTGGGGGRRKRRFGVLRRHPDLDPSGRDVRGAGLRLHGRVREERNAVFGLDPLGGAGERRGDIAGRLRNRRIGRIEASANVCADRFARHLAVAAVVPDDRQRVGRAFGPPPAIGDDGDGIRQAHDVPDALHVLDRCFVHRLQPALEDGAVDDRRVKHVRQPDVDGVDRLAGDFVGDLQPPARGAGKLPVLGVFELHLFRRRHPGGVFGDLAERQAPLARGVGDDAVGGNALRRRHAPARGSRRNQHFTRGGAGLTQVVLRCRDRAAGAGRHVAPDALAERVRLRCDEFQPDLVPVAFKLFGDQHGEAGGRALPHLGAGDPDDHGVVRLDHDPAVDFGRAFVGTRRRGTARNGNSQCKPATRGACTNQERSATKLAAGPHADPL